MTLRSDRRFVLALLLALVAACTQRGRGPEEVARDLHDYMGELRKWESTEKTVFEAIADVERSQYVDDDFVVRTLKSALPAVDERIRGISAYQPKTNDLSEVHDRYRNGWADLKAGCEAIIAAMEMKDYVRLATAKNKLQTARRDILAAFQVLDAMLEEAEPELRSLRKS